VIASIGGALIHLAALALAVFVARLAFKRTQRTWIAVLVGLVCFAVLGAALIWLGVKAPASVDYD
jgi:protein-S-isoprenylcysteine O-methyltransferase Ste14